MSDHRQRALDALDRANAICAEIEEDRANRDPFAIDPLEAWRTRQPETPKPERKRIAMSMHPEAQKGWDEWFETKAKARERQMLEGIGKALSHLMRDTTAAHVKLMRESNETFTAVICKLEERIQELEAQVIERDSHADLARALPSTKRLAN